MRNEELNQLRALRAGIEALITGGSATTYVNDLRALLDSSAPATASEGATEPCCDHHLPQGCWYDQCCDACPATGVTSADGSSNPGSSLEDAGSTDGDREGLSDERRELLLALALADGQDWRGWVNTSEHTAEMMYGRQADAVESILAARLAEVTAERDETREYGDHTSCVESYSALQARADALAEQVAAVQVALEVRGGPDLCVSCDGHDVRATGCYAGSLAARIDTAIGEPASVLAARDAKVAAQAWDRGYSCGLGDCGKDQARETTAANPYRQRAAGGEVEQP